METLKELKAKILEKIKAPELKAKYEKLVSQNEIFETNKQMAYYYIAREVGVKLQVNVASASKEAFPLDIGKIVDDEKQNFNISGYIMGDVRPFVASNSKQMAFVQIADNTGTINITVWEEQLEQFQELVSGDFVTVSNLYWKDKTKFNPSYGQYSGITKVEPTFSIGDVIVNAIAEMQDEKYYVIKGLVVDIPDGTKTQPFHCATGHWFQGLSDKDLGTDSKCAKCEDIMEVEQHVHVSGMVFADTEKDVVVNLSVFAGLDDVNVFDELILRGQYKDEVFNANTVIPIKKK